jgi:hypothetical protein
MTRATLFFAAALVLVIGGSGANAGLIQFEANLDPFQEVPPHNTPGYGSADVTLNTTSGAVTISDGVYADLLAGATSVRIQDAAVGANGPTIMTLTLDTPGNMSGTFSSGTGNLTAAEITDMMNGNTYINIADSVYPSGEIRGQILPGTVPEPSSILLCGLGALAMVPLVWQRRKHAV